MAGRAATVNIIPGQYALAVGRPDMPAPRGWVWTALSDLAQLESGHTPSRKHPEYWGGDVAWISIPDARDHHGKVIMETLQRTNQLGLDNSAARLLPFRTVCLSRTASVGYALIMGRPMATSQDFVNWICSEGLVPEWLMQLFIAEKESLFRFGKGTTHTTIYYPEVKAFHVCVPPVNEQRRIVAKIEALTARSRRAKEALDAIPPLLERFRQSVLAAAFRGDLTADWRTKNPDVEPATALLERIRVERRRRWEEAELAKMRAKGKEPKDDKWNAKYQEPEPVETTGLPELPEGWCWASVEELCWDGPTNGYSGATTGTALGTLTMKLSATTLGRIVLNDSTTKRLTETIDHDSKFWLHDGDLLVQRANSLNYLGAAAIFQSTNEPMVYPDLMIRLRATDALVTTLLWRYFNGPACRAWFRSKATGTAGNMPKINGEVLKQTAVPLCPLREARHLLDLVAQLLRGIDAVAERSAALDQNHAALDQSILAKAFRGELVPQDPNDEPASVLLERIRAERAASEMGKSKRGPGKRTPEPESVEDPPIDEPAPAPASPEPSERPTPPAAPFTDLDIAAQLQAFYEALLGRGALEKDTAVRQAGDHLRDTGLVDFQRLRTGGPLYKAIEGAIDAGVRQGLFDRPRRGHVRALLVDAADYTPDHWRLCLLEALDGEPTDRDEAVRAAAEWARDNLGLEFQRLRSGGTIDTGLRNAINSAVRRGEVVAQRGAILRREGEQP